MSYDSTTFNLSIGQVSDPIASDGVSPGAGQYIIFMASDRDPNRVLASDMYQTVRSKAFYDLIQKDVTRYVVQDFTSQDSAWVAKQLAKASKN